MPFEKNNNHSKGRPRGSQNKETKQIREALNTILTNNLDDIDTKLKEVAENNPAKYIELLLRICEYSISKIQSTQIVENQQDSTTYRISFTD